MERRNARNQTERETRFVKGNRIPYVGQGGDCDGRGLEALKTARIAIFFIVRGQRELTFERHSAARVPVSMSAAASVVVNRGCNVLVTGVRVPVNVRGARKQAAQQIGGGREPNERLLGTCEHLHIMCKNVEAVKRFAEI